jgi:hypothetical protein
MIFMERAGSGYDAAFLNIIFFSPEKIQNPYSQSEISP